MIEERECETCTWTRGPVEMAKETDQISSVVIWSPSLVTPSPAPSISYAACKQTSTSHLVVCSSPLTPMRVMALLGRSWSVWREARPHMWARLGYLPCLFGRGMGIGHMMGGRTTAWKLQFSLAKHLDKPGT